ncbi:MAG: FAD-dependent oxidoreductase [Lachnospiraceae bacterium]|nr:FAD-dependent oxidoreductase [Lachnospiraceae bacterium]
MGNVNTITLPATEIEVVDIDVCVAGGGTAGCMAAIAAARNGAKVLMVEKLPVPGGTLTNGGIGVSSYYNQCDDPKDAKRIVGGLAYEMIDKLIESGGATSFAMTPDNPQRNAYRVVADHEPYKGVIAEMLMEAGVEVLLNCMVSEVVMDGSKIDYIVVDRRDKRVAYRAKTYVDATGDGDVAKKAGATMLDMTHGQECATGMVFGIGGIDWDRVLEENKGVFHEITSNEMNDKGVMNKNYIFALGYAPQKYGMMKSLEGIKILSMQVNHPGEATYVNLSRGEILDGTDPEELSKAELRVRLRLKNIVEDFKKYVPGFENAYLSWASVQLGVRISYIVKCDYSITQDDIHNARRFDDEIGLYGFHDLAAKAGENIPIQGDGFYGFPYRMLLPVGCDNLLVAGRCVTEEYEAHMSTRNTVGCMIMGEAAGTAAAICSKSGKMTREIEYAQLAEALKKDDVILSI